MRNTALASNLMGKPPLPPSRGATPPPIGTSSSNSSVNNLHSVESAGNLGIALANSLKHQPNYAKPISREHSEHDLKLIAQETNILEDASQSVESLVALIGIKKTPTRLNLQQAQSTALTAIIQAGQDIKPELVVKIRTQEIFSRVLASNS